MMSVESEMDEGSGDDLHFVQILLVRPTLDMIVTANAESDGLKGEIHAFKIDVDI